ncbi:MAG: serine/threonine-protein kinase [Deltaproteobacteria bacterium]
MPHRYELLALIGEGGMGKVYRARHRGLDKIVALKVLDPRLAKHHETMRNAERFAREARAIARLDHPGCVRIYDHAAGFIAMELLDGPTLGTILGQQGQLSIARALAIADDLLGALAHAHAHGVLHRDLKPENVMLVKRGAVIIDFGLAALHDAAKLTLEGLAFGTPSYLAPERLRGEPYDARSDLYAVGVMLYEMIAGLKPFVGSDRREIMRNALDRPPRPLRVLCPEIPTALDEIIMRALAKDPARRFADAEDMRFALGGIELAGSSPTSSTSGSTMIELAMIEPSRWARLWAWMRYGRWRWRHRPA